MWVRARGDQCREHVKHTGIYLLMRPHGQPQAWNCNIHNMRAGDAGCNVFKMPTFCSVFGIGLGAFVAKLQYSKKHACGFMICIISLRIQRGHHQQHQQQQQQAVCNLICKQNQLNNGGWTIHAQTVRARGREAESDWDRARDRI